MIVFGDADIESALNGVIAGNFGATGQSCVTGSRDFIQPGIRKDFLAQLVTRAPKRYGSVLLRNQSPIRL